MNPKTPILSKLFLLIKIAIFCLGAWLSARFGWRQDLDTSVPTYFIVGPIFGIVVLSWWADSIRAFLNWRPTGFLISSTLIYAFIVWMDFRFSLNHLYVGILVGIAILSIIQGFLFKSPWDRIGVAIPAACASVVLMVLVPHQGPPKHFDVYLGILIGTAILSSARALLFKSEWQRTAISIPILCASVALMMLPMYRNWPSTSAYSGPLVGTAMLSVAHTLLLNSSWRRTVIAIPAIYFTWLILSYSLIGRDNYNMFGIGISIWQGAYLLFMFGEIKLRWTVIGLTSLIGLGTGVRFDWSRYKLAQLTERCKKIQVGMTFAQVEDIMGKKPNVRTILVRDNVKKNRLTFSTWRLETLSQVCIMDPITGLVEEVTCGRE